MKDYIRKDEWNIIEQGFKPEHNRISESIFSIGNGRMGQRANFEEKYSGDSLQGSYLAGVYYPDKTRVGWWKNGYPEYFAKIVNSINWIGINVMVNGEELDLANCQVHNFERRLNMKSGVLSRTADLTMANGIRLSIKSTRFISLTEPDAGIIRYEITPVSGVDIKVESYLDGAVTNEDSNYDETFWYEVNRSSTREVSNVTMETRKTGFHASASAKNVVTNNEQTVNCEEASDAEGFVSQSFTSKVSAGTPLVIEKYVSMQISLYADKDSLPGNAIKRSEELAAIGIEKLQQDHADKWQEKWQESDIVIDGDLAGQQAIRYNIFQLYQTYTGDDPRLNIGPKGFTGEKYGGVTYWDTEAYCLPFYLRTADQTVARNLLKYRHNHLEKAIENAEKLGFKNGAALYPMVTINGEECHNEWEITFEEIHRNGAIAYAIYNYINYTGDHSVMGEFALEVLVGISRFWSQRISYSEAKKAYVMLGVTGPNEYENNVNNNWYTSTIACWTMEYTLEQIKWLEEADPDRLREVLKLLNFDKASETSRWQEIIKNMYLPKDDDKRIFLQQDGFLDKELIPVSKLPASERPIHKKWSWDRILRSCYIKQADVLQGIYMLEEHYDLETIARNYRFYEPLTVHESSLSASIHSILACVIGDYDLAYEMYLRTARLDLDDYNDDTDDGLHITSMGGTWMSIVEGFAGLRVKDNVLSLNPSLPKSWQGYSFRIVFRGIVLKFSIRKEGISIENNSDQDLCIEISGLEVQIAANDTTELSEDWQETAVV